jgi:hypothetical protein
MLRYGTKVRMELRDVHAQGTVASMKAEAPDFAMVPRLLISSLLVMPTPES